jgi:hypothetical protein
MPSSDYHVNGPVTGSLPVDMTSGDALQNAGYIFVTAARSQTGGVNSDGVYASALQSNPNAKGLRLYTTVANGSGTVVVKVQVQNPYTDVWIDLAGAATAALNNNAGALITIYPGLTGIADSTGVTINQHLGPIWRLVATVATASETFSVGADYLM